MNEKKLSKIEIENIIGEEKYVIEYLPNNKLRFPEIPVPSLEGERKLYLSYLFGEDELAPEVYPNDKCDEKLKKLIESSTIRKCLEEYVVPKVTFQDVTEKVLLGSETITKEYLDDKNRGLWSDYGNRMIEIEFSDVNCFIGEVSVRMNFIEINGEKSINQNYASDYFKLGNKMKSLIVELDTDLLGQAFCGKFKTKQRLKFSGYIEVSCKNELSQYIIYKYPIDIMIINTNPKVCDPLLCSDKPASIDFGTSSTCVAIESDEKIELLSLSPKPTSEEQELSSLPLEPTSEEQINLFENPTNIMVYNWEMLYKEWNKQNKDMPLPKKGNKEMYLRTGDVGFDFGYSVKEILGEEDTSRKELNAILSLIKMIPFQIIQEKQQLDFNPYNDKKIFVDIVTDPDKCDEKHFDPVAFYGYLIGRAVNDLTKRNKIFTEFHVTSPVMFNPEIKKTLEKSLKYGLERSVPKKLRKDVKVYMKHTEPVAYIGALCGTQYFKIPENERKFFAVYDFGGGTLDFSFGIASNEDDEVVLNILKVGGREKFGGEILIEKIAFQIYCSSQQEMLKKDIPIIIPFGENIPEEMPESMFMKNDFAKANMNIISAKIARRIFEDKQDEINSPISLELYNKDGELIDCSFSIQIEDINNNLEEEIKDTIESFKRELCQAFKNEKDFNVNEVYIFKAGNSSRSKIVEEKMKEIFEGNENIQLVDQTSDNKRYALTPKTAVAFGQLRLNNFDVQGDSDYFKYYIGFFNEGTGEFKICIDNSEKEKGWKKFRKIKNNDIDIFYSRYIPEGKEKARIPRIPISVPNHKGDYLWIAIKDDTTIKYCVGPFEKEGDIPGDVKIELLTLK